MRVYLPTTLDGLREHVAAGAVRTAQRVVAESDSEEDEYAAMTAAAELSQQLLTGPGVRVVLVAETEAAGPDDPVGLTDVVAVHADSDPVDPDDDDPPELGWYAVQELGDLLR